MDTQNFIIRLEQEWDLDNGFFGLLRQGHFSDPGFNRLLGVLVDIQNSQVQINKRLVSLLWYIPIFMIWQNKRLNLNNCDTQLYDEKINLVIEKLEIILGIP